MPIDARLITNAIQPAPDLPDPFTQFLKIQGARNAVNQGQLQQQQIQSGALGLQEQQRQITEGQRLRELFAQQPDIEKALPEVMRINPQTGLAMQKGLIAAKKERAELDLKQAEVASKKAERLGSLTESVTDEPSAHASLAQAFGEGLIDKQHVDAILSQPWSADVLKTIKTFGQQAMSAKDQIDARIKQAKEEHEARMRPAQEQKATADATLAEQKATGTEKISPLDELKLNREVDALHETMRHNKSTENQALLNETETQRFHNLSLEGIKLTPESTDKMAEMFATTGVLPSLGIGQAAGRNKSIIINRASELYPNVQFATNKAAFQANQASLRKLQSQSDVTDAFENTAGKNIDIFLKAAGKIVDTGSPLLNAPVRMLTDRVFGSENMAAFKAARETALTEAAKVLESPQGGGALTVSGRDAVKTLSDPSATLGQQVDSMKVLRQDMASRKQSNKEQIDAIQKRISSPGGEGKTEESSGSFQEGQTATNPQTGQRAVFKGGKWVIQ